MKTKVSKVVDSARKFLESDSGAATATKIVLAIVAIGGIVVLAGMAPNIFAVAKLFDRSKKLKAQQIKYAYYNLKRDGFLKTGKNRSGETELILTDKGRARVLDFDIDLIEIKKPWRWDGKWRVLTYDIPVRFRKAREAFRLKISELGLAPMQKSVWIYPYDCLDEIMFVANYFGVEKFIDFLEVDRLTHA